MSRYIYLLKYRHQASLVLFYMESVHFLTLRGHFPYISFLILIVRRGIDDRVYTSIYSFDSSTIRK
jgi:hypothetical protein